MASQGEGVGEQGDTDLGKRLHLETSLEHVIEQRAQTLSSRGSVFERQCLREAMSSSHNVIESLRPQDARPRQRGTLVTGLNQRIANATSRSRSSRAIIASKSANGIMLGPSLGEVSGSGCVSKKSASVPIATAARAKGSTISRFPPVAPPSPPGTLDTVGGVKDDRDAQFSHQHQRLHVIDQSSVAKEGAPFAQHDPPGPTAGDFFDHVLHIFRRHELAFLDVDGSACRGGGDQQVGLPAPEMREFE